MVDVLSRALPLAIVRELGMRRYLRHVPDLTAALDDDAAREAHAAVVGPVFEAETGVLRFPGAAQDGGPPAVAALIVSGLLGRAVGVHEASSLHLLGPGDAIEPWPGGDGVEFVVMEKLTFVAIDERFVEATRRWPELGIGLLLRSREQIRDLSVLHAVCQLPRVDARLLALMWMLAHRWGRVTPSGTWLPLRLRHETLGRLIGAKRPTVSLGMKSLANDGRVVRAARGGWLLTGEAPIGLP